jgi:glycerol-3-phosphate dehydrogenase
MYDWLAGRERIGRHRTLSAVEMAHAAAGLRTQGLLGGFEFFDAQMDDARLCLEVVLTAQASGVAAINYVEAVGLTRQNGSVNGCQLLEQLTGDHIRVTARSVVNAAGPWLDLVCRMDDQTAPVQLAASKGVHIILPHMELPAGLLVTHPADGRVMFVLPWMNRTLVGTTDTFTQEMPDNITASPADTDYLLVAVNHYFGKSLSRRDVINTIAGLRPLLRQNVQQPSAASREFSVVRSASGLWSIAGGKYTTYRSMAEQLTDRIVADLGGSLSGLPSRTASHRLVGAPSQDWCEFRERERSEMIEKYRLEPPVIDHLIDRYGTRARCVVEECDESVAWERVVAREPDVWAEFHYQSRHEMAVRSADHLLRRTRLGLFWPESFVAELTPPQLDWNRAGGVPQSTEAS